MLRVTPARRGRCLALRSQTSGSNQTSPGYSNHSSHRNFSLTSCSPYGDPSRTLCKFRPIHKHKHPRPQQLVQIDHAQQCCSVRMSLPLPPPNTWLSFLACVAFQGTVAVLCLHEHGAALANRAPSIFGRWLRRRQGANGGGGIIAPAKINPPSSLSKSWRLGALHERFFKGVRPGEQSMLGEAGDLLGIGRALTEVRRRALSV